MVFIERMVLMMKKKFLALLLVGVLGICSLVGCGKSNSTANNTGSKDSADSKETSSEYDGTVSIAFTTWVGYAPLFIAKEKGIFEKNGVDMDLRIIESAGDIKTAVASNSIQGYAMTVDTIVMGMGAGLDTTQVLALDTSCGGDGVVCKSEYNSLSELKGKKVAIDTSGGASLFYFYYLLGEQGLTMDDFDIQNMSAGDAGSAFVGGSVDAAVTWEPWLTNAKDTDFGKVLCDSTETPGVICDTLCFNAEFIEKYPDTVQAICDSWFEALEMLNAKDTHEECMDIMAQYLGMTREELESVADTVEFYDKEKNKEYIGGGELQKMSEYAAKVWYELKLVDKEVDCSKAVDTKFVAK